MRTTLAMLELVSSTAGPGEEGSGCGTASLMCQNSTIVGVDVVERPGMKAQQESDVSSQARTATGHFQVSTVPVGAQTKQ